MAHGAFNGVTGPLAGYRSVSADPRSGTGLAATPGVMAYDGTSYYQCVGTGVNDWVKVPFYARSVLAGADVASVTLSGLNGNVDRIYHFAFYVNQGAQVQTYLQPNGAPTDCESSKIFWVGAPGSYDSNATVGWWAGMHRGVAAARFTMTGTIYAKSGIPRTMKAIVNEMYDNAGGSGYKNYVIGTWFNTADNLTSLKINAASACIAAGSIFTIWADPSGAYL
jgi:hypothetical protein